MYNPKTTLAEAYVETWRRARMGSAAEVVLLERRDGRAFVGRVGPFALGLSEGAEGEAFAAWRDEMTDGEWVRVKQVGLDGKDSEGKLPPRLPISAVGLQGWEVGKTVALGDDEWIVRENFVMP
jgi:hypothetical protein